MTKILKIISKLIKCKKKIFISIFFNFFAITPLISISVSDSSSVTTNFNDKYKIVATNDDNEISYQDPSKNTDSSIYIIKKFSTNWQKQIDLLKDISLNENKQIFRVTIDRVNNLYNFKESAFTINDIKTRAVTANFESKPIIYYLKLDSSTVNGKVAKEFALINKEGKRFEAQLKWVNINNKWNLELSYKQFISDESDSIYRYKAELISNPKIIEEINKGDELFSLINSKITKTSGLVDSSKSDDNLLHVASKINNAQLFKEYSGIDLTTIPNINKAIFFSREIHNGVNVIIEVHNSTATEQKIKYKITYSQITMFKSVDSLNRDNIFMYQTKYQTNDDIIYLGTPKGLKQLVENDDGFYSLKIISGVSMGINFMYQTRDNRIFVQTNDQGLKRLVENDDGSYSLKSISNTKIESIFMYQTKDERIYFLAPEGLKQLVKNANGSYSIKTIPNLNIGSIFMYEIKDRKIFIGTFEGLKELVKNANGSYSLKTISDLNISFNFMHETKDRKIFIGTSEGLKELVKNADDSYSIKTILNTNLSLIFIYETKDKRIFVGTSEGLKELVKNADDSYSLKSISNTNLRFIFMYQTKDGSIYVNTSEGLQKLVNEIYLDSVSFQVSGTQGSGALKIKDDVSLPEQVEATYAKALGDHIPQASDYLPEPPSSLSNDEKVYIKFKIKTKYAKTHQLPTSFENQIIFPVVGLPKNDVIVSKLKLATFQVSGTQGSGALKIKDDVSLPEQVEATYAKALGDHIPQASDYLPAPPSSLSNDEKVYIKFKIKTKYAKTHQLPTSFENQIIFPVVGLPKNDVIVSKLKLATFQVSGTQGSGALKIKDDVSLPKHVEATYAKASGGQIPQASDYLPAPPSSLSNGEKVYIKFKIKTKYAKTHQLSTSFENQIIFPVVGLPKNDVIVSKLKLATFQVSGTEGTGTLKIKDDVSLPKHVEATYAKASGGQIPQASDYLPAPPSSLSNGEKVYIKFKIKTKYAKTHQLPSDFTNPIVFTTTGLNQIESPKSEISKSKTKTSSNKVKKQAKKTKLSKGAIAGIVIGSILVVGAIGTALAVKFLKVDIKKIFKKRKKKK